LLGVGGVGARVLLAAPPLRELGGSAELAGLRLLGGRWVAALRELGGCAALAGLRELGGCAALAGLRELGGFEAPLSLAPLVFALLGGGKGVPLVLVPLAFALLVGRAPRLLGGWSPGSAPLAFPLAGFCDSMPARRVDARAELAGLRLLGGRWVTAFAMALRLVGGWVTALALGRCPLPGFSRVALAPRLVGGWVAALALGRRPLVAFPRLEGGRVTALALAMRLEGGRVTAFAMVMRSDGRVGLAALRRPLARLLVVG
jgi:hypothetical protein